MKICPKCSTKYDGDQCPKCGLGLSVDNESQFNQNTINKPSVTIFISIGVVVVLLFSVLGIVIYNHSKTVSEPSIDLSHFMGGSNDDNSTSNDSSNTSLVDSSIDSGDSHDITVEDKEENASGDIDTVYSIDEWMHSQMDRAFEEYTDNEQIIAYVDEGEIVRIDAFPDESYSLYRTFFYDNGELKAAIYSDEDDTENHVFYLEDGSIFCVATWNYDLEQYENSFSQDDWGKWPGYLYSHSGKYWEVARQLVDQETSSDEENYNDSDFVLPNSSSEYLSMDDLDGLTKNECRIARNEVYARHGRKFKDESLRDYFNQFDWYEPTIDPDDFNDKAMLSEIERKNLDLILEYESNQGYR